MKVERITAKGFLSHTGTDLVLNGSRLTTLVGANGAGKSGLLEVIRFVLYGQARAGVDNLVQLGASEMSATVEFSYADNRYRATRGRSTRAGGKSYLELHVADGEGWRPLTRESIRDTQAAIEELLRMDAAAFETAAFLVQGRANAFADATAAERKRILGTVLGLDRYERAEARTRELVRDLDARLAAQRDQVARLDEQLADRQTHQDAVDHYRGELADLQENREEHVNELARWRDERTAAAVKEAEIEAARADVARLTAAVDQQADRWKAARARYTTAGQQLARAQATLAQEPRVVEAQQRVPVLEQQLEAARAAETAWQQATAEVERHAAEARDAQRDLDVAERRLQELEAQRSDTTVCPECGATIPAGGRALEERIEAASVVQADARAFVAGLPPVTPPPAKPVDDPWRVSQELTEAKGLAAATASLDEARRIAEEAKAASVEAAGEMAEAEAAGKRARAELDAAKAKIAERQQTYVLAEVDDEIAYHASLIEALDHHDIPLATEGLARAQAFAEQLAKVQEQRDRLATAIAGDEAEAARLKRLVLAFGVNGIPARIIESVLPELSAYANELLGQLRPGMALELRAQRAKKDGSGVVEALDLVVRDDVGERPLSLFSGGERMSVSLAVAVGLSRLVARRAGTAIRTLVIDEPDGLDVDARRAFGAALRVLAHAGELERILLVSHHEDLAEVGDAVYRVSKNGHGSVLEQVS